MENVLKIASIAIAAALGAAVIKKQVPEIGLILSVLAGAIILSLSLDAIQKAKSVMEMLADTAALSPAILTPVVKTIGIAIATKVTSEICKDAKESGIAAFVEIAGASGALLVCLPLLEAVLALITEFL